MGGGVGFGLRPGWETTKHLFPLVHLSVSLPPDLLIFSPERSLDQVSDEPAIGDPLNVESSGHPGLRGDIRVGVHFQHIDLPILANAEIHPGIIPASE